MSAPVLVTWNGTVILPWVAWPLASNSKRRTPRLSIRWKVWPSKTPPAEPNALSARVEPAFTLPGPPIWMLPEPRFLGTRPAVSLKSPGEAVIDCCTAATMALAMSLAENDSWTGTPTAPTVPRLAGLSKSNSKVTTFVPSLTWKVCPSWTAVRCSRPLAEASRLCSIPACKSIRT